MTCFNPKYAKYWYTVGANAKGERIIKKELKFVTAVEYEEFKPTENMIGAGKMLIPCRKCLGCKIDMASQWATRCVIEAKQWGNDNNCFITLTYDDEHLKSKSLIKKDIQNFLKKLRKEHKGIKSRTYKGKEEYSIRYFYSGEYGEKFKRPHFHIGIFNWKPTDLIIWKTRGNIVEYISPTISKLWKNGYHLIEDMTYGTATYIARYTLKKLYKHKCNYQEKELIPEFIETSRRGGIGINGIETAEFEKIKRNMGVWIKTPKGNRCFKIPQFLRNKWLELDRLEYFEKIDQDRMRKEIEAKKALEQTDLSEEEMLKNKKETLIAKLKNSKAHKRDRIEENLAQPELHI